MVSDAEREQAHRDYMRGLAGENPASMHGQIGSMVREQQAQWHEQNMAPYKAAAKSQSSSGSGGGGSAGHDGGIDAPIAEWLHDLITAPYKRYSLWRTAITTARWLCVVAAAIFLFYASKGQIGASLLVAFFAWAAPLVVWHGFFYVLAILEVLVRTVVLVVLGFFLFSLIGGALFAIIKVLL